MVRGRLRRLLTIRVTKMVLLRRLSRSRLHAGMADRGT